MIPISGPKEKCASHYWTKGRTPSARHIGARPVKKTDFEGLVAGLEDALAYAKGQPNPGTRETAVEVDRAFVAAARLEAGPTPQEFARAAGASLGTIRKWERGERSPSGAARMLAPILARDPALMIAETRIGREGGAETGWRTQPPYSELRN
jgi:putative transcriptional regulator